MPCPGKLNFLTFDIETATIAAGDYQRLRRPWVRDQFFGIGFTYAAFGVPTGGIVTEYRELVGGIQAVDLSGVSIPVTTLEYWAANAASALAASTVFAGNDAIFGTNSNDVLYGYAGNDILFGGLGSDQLNGGPVTDTAFFPPCCAKPTILSLGWCPAPVLATPWCRLNRCVFMDGTLSNDPATPAAQILRLYQTALGRAPDPAGLSGWVSALNGGTPLVAIAQGFLGSTESNRAFPAQGTTRLSFLSSTKMCCIVHPTPPG